MTSAATPRESATREFLSGVRLIGRGFGMWTDSPKLMLLGAIPALVVGLLYLAAVVVLVLALDSIVLWATPFADGWDEPWLTIFRIFVGLAVLVLATFLLVRTYTGLTLAIGDPFYERIWRDIEARLGDAPADDTTFWTGIGRGLRSFLSLTAISLLLGIGLFVLGLVPVVGAPLSIAVGAVLGGNALALELTGYAMDARGVGVRDRRRLLRQNRARTLGFGMVTYLMFLVPILSVVTMPAAVVGATILARESLGENVTPTTPA